MSKGREVILPGDRYVFEDSVVGEGAQGKVHLGYDLTNNDRIAIKFVNKHALKEKNLQRLDTEVKILTEIKHKNIVSFKCFYSDYVLPLDCGGNGFPWGVIVMENCPYDLFDYLLSLGSFSEDVSRTYFNQLIDGLNACHKKGVYHRDIKPENLLLDSNFQLKIADFGLASMSEEYASSSTSIGTKSSLLRSYCGSNAYMAPEVFAGQAYEGKFADLWSSAVVLFVMVSGFQPFQVPAPNDWWMNKIINFRYARFWEAHVRSGPHLARYSQFRDLINNMFVYDANNRYDLNQIRQHIWMNGKVLHPEELEDIMAYQEEVVRKAKRIDRERKNAERVKKMNAKSTAATANGTFNAFARDKVHRDIACSVPTRNELLTKHDIIVSSGTESLHGDFIMFEKILKQIDDKCVYSVDPRNYTFTIDEIMLPGLMLSATDTEDMEQLPGLQLQNIECHMYLYKCEDIALTMMTFVSCVPEDLNYMHATHVQANPSVNATATVFSNIPDTMTKKAQTPMSMLQIKPLITLLRKYFDELDASDNDITTSTAPYLKDNNNARDGMDTEEEDGEDVMGMI